MFAGNTGEIEKHFFKSEVQAYNMDPPKRAALKAILLRCTKKVDLIAEHDPEVAMEAGQGAIYIKYRCKSSGAEYDNPVPSYLTPDGISTGLFDVLLTAWMMEYHNDVGEPPKGSKLLLEAAIAGLSRDGPALKAAGFASLSQDGLKFASIDAILARLERLRTLYAAAAQSGS